MSLLRRRRGSSKGADVAVGRQSLAGYAVLLRRTDIDDQDGVEILNALEKQHDVNLANEDGLQHRVVIDDAYDPDEAVVRLALALDGINCSWQEHFGWPKAIGPATKD